MTNAQHTPGPYTVDDNRLLKRFDIQTPGEIVASVSYWGPNPEGDANFFAAACASYDKHFGPNAIAAAEDDLLGKALEALRHLVRSVDDLISESEGVYGLHLNGDPAPWYSLTEGGHFEDWLIELERARAFLTKAGKDGQ